MGDTRLLVAKTVALAIVTLFLFNGSALFAQDSAEKASEPVYEVGNGVTPPKGVYTPNPEYSDKARKKKVKGTVVVAMIVTREGTVRDLKITESLEEGLDNQVLAAVRTWRFEPAIKDGKPVAVHLNAEVSFNL